MRVGIIGCASDKFSIRAEKKAKDIIHQILSRPEAEVLVSGHCPIGGVDIWAEEEAKLLEMKQDIKIPKQHSWDGEYGFKKRNLDIARDSDGVHVIVVDRYPKGYNGRRFTDGEGNPFCYHCRMGGHIKSGGCWTGHKAKDQGKKVTWHIISQEGTCITSTGLK